MIVTAELHHLSTGVCMQILGYPAQKPIVWYRAHSHLLGSHHCQWLLLPLKARGALDSSFFFVQKGQQIVIANVYDKVFS